MPGLPNVTYIIKDEQVRGQAFGQILLNPGLLASQELSHDRLDLWTGEGEQRRRPS